MESQRDWEARFFKRLATTYLSCRLAVMGGRPLSPHWTPITNFETLGWHMLGMMDYDKGIKYEIDSRRAALQSSPCTGLSTSARE